MSGGCVLLQAAVVLSPQTLPADPQQQRWPWWALLPLYPYGTRPTLLRELIPGRVWSLEQLHGIWYVAVPIRMTVLRVEGGLLLYAPLPPTRELLADLHGLEEHYGPVISIVLGTSSGLEHKLPVAALARAFPEATLWVSDKQWSFPISLPSTWLGFPRNRTRVLGVDGWPHAEQLVWISLGPIDLGLGCFHEVACIDQATGSLLVTDALVSITKTPPPIFDLDPTPLLFHARQKGSDPLVDSSTMRMRGWKRIVLFANYFRPQSVRVPSLQQVLQEAIKAEHRRARSHFGIYPFEWSSGWEEEADQLIDNVLSANGVGLAPVLERLVFPRSKSPFIAWMRSLANASRIDQLIAAHYDAPVEITNDSLRTYAAMLEQRQWAPSEGSWQLLAAIDSTLVKWKLVPN